MEAKLIAKAQADAAFRQALLDNPKAAVERWGISQIGRDSNNLGVLTRTKFDETRDDIIAILIGHNIQDNTGNRLG
jgi:hypothetical protein